MKACKEKLEMKQGKLWVRRDLSKIYEKFITFLEQWLLNWNFISLFSERKSKNLDQVRCVKDKDESVLVSDWLTHAVM